MTEVLQRSDIVMCETRLVPCYLWLQQRSVQWCADHQIFSPRQSVDFDQSLHIHVRGLHGPIFLGPSQPHFCLARPSPISSLFIGQARPVVIKAWPTLVEDSLRDVFLRLIGRTVGTNLIYSFMAEICRRRPNYLALVVCVHFML